MTKNTVLSDATSTDRSSEVTAPPQSRLPWALFGFGFLVSFCWSWRPSLWTDEAATISAAQRTLPELANMAHHIDAVHATYYAFMHVWVQIFGTSQLLLRLPSALAVGVTTTLAYWLGQRLAGRRVGLFGAVAFAVLPRTTWMGAEARSYALSGALAAAATLLVVAAVSTSKIRARWWPLMVGYGLVAALGVATNIYLALLLVAHGISLLLSRTAGWRLRWAWLTASLAAVLSSSPVVWAAVHQGGQLGGGDFGPVQWFRDVGVSQWFLGETPTPSVGTALSVDVGSSWWWKIAAVILAVACWALIATGVWRHRSSSPLMVWVLPWIAVPVVVIGLYSLGVKDIYNGRYFSYTTPAVGLLLGQGFGALRRSWARVGLAALILLCAVPIYVSQRTVYAKDSTDWSGIAAFVDAHRGATVGEAVYFSPRYPVTGPLVGQTARGVRVAYPRPFADLADITLLRTPIQDSNLTGTSRLLADSRTQLAAATAIWVIRRADSPSAAADDQTLSNAGFTATIEWRGPLDVVIRYARR